MGHYIVMLEDSVEDTQAVAEQQVAEHGGVLGFIYKSINGYSARFLPESAEELLLDPAVDYITPDSFIWMDESSGVEQWHSCPLAPPLPEKPSGDPEDPEGPSLPEECSFEEGDMGHYIVILEDSVEDTQAVAEQQVAEHGGVLGFIYKSINGYSARFLPESAEELLLDPAVDYITPDSFIWMDESSGIEQWHSCPLAPPLPEKPSVDPELPGESGGDGSDPLGGQSGGVASQQLTQPIVPPLGQATRRNLQQPHCLKPRKKRGKRCSQRRSAGSKCKSRKVLAKRRCSPVGT